ncbi:glutamate receptor U1-like, partial [Patella vulgata]|uniref:glutamate receptor U1-like n=1 Tax=Patella vulgata TaxID=6465 RepID=UPI0024A7E9F7
VADGNYGGQNEVGEWQGLVGQLTRQEVDIVIADLSLTKERSRVIDFILPPFHTTNLAALLDDISGAFFVALIGLAITLLVLLVEIIVKQIMGSKLDKCRYA